METMRLLVTVAVCLCALGAQDSSKPPGSAAPQAAIRARTQDVLLDLVVRDKKGRPLNDLTANNVQVLDEGTPGKIMGLRLVSAGDAAALGPQAANDPTQHARLVSLVFEKLDTEERRFARQAALDFLGDDLADNVYLAVFVADPRLRVIQPFTNDHSLVHQAIEQASTADYAQLAAQSEATRKKLEDSLQPKASPGGAVSAPAGLTTLLTGMTLRALQSEEQLVRTKQWRSSILALLSLVEEQARVPGRKTLIYFAEDLQVPDSMTEVFNNTIAAANHSKVSVYGVDTRGWSSEEHGKKSLLKLHKGAPPAPSTPPPAALDQLSSNTGGFLIGKSKDFREPFRRVSEDINAYYEISYLPPNAAYNGKLRKVTVQVDVPDVKVQARSGYLSLPSNEGSAFVYELPLLRALNATPLPTDFPIQAGALHFRPEGAKLGYGLVVEAPFKDLTFIEDKATHSFRAHVSMLALLKDEQGEILDRFSRDLPVEETADKIEALRRGSFMQTHRLDLPPGQYTLDAAVIDRQSQKASARRVAVAVPQVHPGVNISSLALVRRVEPQAGDADAQDPFRYQGGKVIPTLDNSIPATSSSDLSFYLVVYPAASEADRPQLNLEFFNKEGASVGQASPDLPPPSKDGLIPYVATLPLANFSPGTYELRATVKQGASMAEERMSFSINP
jgi:VWFA-related protein